jgi:hypothetical protein
LNRTFNMLDAAIGVPVLSSAGWYRFPSAHDFAALPNPCPGSLTTTTFEALPSGRTVT